MKLYKQIVWISSWPKSGNTWVRCFLDAYFMGEVDINELLSSVSDSQAFWYQIGDGSKVEDLPLEIQTLTRNMALLRMVNQYNRDEKPIPMFIKSHTACMQINGTELIPDLLTKATIFIVRDPRDVLISFANHMGTDIDQAIEWMCEKHRMLNATDKTVADFISSWNGHTNSYLNTDAHNVCVIRYEDMQDSPVETFSRLLKHAGIDPVRSKVVKALEIVKLDKLRAQEAKSGFSEASDKAINPFFHKGTVGGWRGQLTPAQVHRIEKRFGTVMKRLGYLKVRAA